MKRVSVGKFIGFIGLCIFVVGISYIVTKYLDKNLYLNTNLLVTFEDTREFTIENMNKMSKEEAEKEYPNKFTVENKSLKNVEYTILLKEISPSSKEKINYILYLNDKEVKEGKLSEIDDVLYTTSISLKKTDTYKLYLYYRETDDSEFKYSIEITSK